MVSSITPGYNFAVDETVTSAKLRTFVEDAIVEGVNWSEVDPTIPRFAITDATDFSLGPEGTIWWNNTTKSLDVQSRWGPVALFKVNGMETRRYAANIAGDTGIGPGLLVRCDTSGDPTSASLPGFEIAAGINNTNLASRVLGTVMYETAVTGTHSRLAIYGMAMVNFNDFQVIDDFGTYGGAVNAAGEFGTGAAETTDRMCGVIMGPVDSTQVAAGVSDIGWVFLFPNQWQA